MKDQPSEEDMAGSLKDAWETITHNLKESRLTEEDFWEWYDGTTNRLIDRDPHLQRSYGYILAYAEIAGVTFRELIDAVIE